MLLNIKNRPSLTLLKEMIENYVHWNEDIGEWQLVSITFILPWYAYGVLPVD